MQNTTNAYGWGMGVNRQGSRAADCACARELISCCYVVVIYDEDFCLIVSAREGSMVVYASALSPL